MKRIEYEDWLRREAPMLERARFILAYFDRSQLRRKPKTKAKTRPSKHSVRPRTIPA